MSFDDAVLKALSFRKERDWEQFHNPKDLAISIDIEASELLEIFQWSGADLEKCDKIDVIKEELADILIYCIYMAKSYDLDIAQIIMDKIEINENKYPVEKSKGKSTKYTEL